jgi:hypothetical protein
MESALTRTRRPGAFLDSSLMFIVAVMAEIAEIKPVAVGGGVVCSSGYAEEKEGGRVLLRHRE